MNKENMEMLNDISNFAGFKSGKKEDITNEEIAVLGVLAESIPPRKSGCGQGPMAIRKMVESLLMSYKQSPSSTVYDIEKDKILRFIGKETGVDFGDVEGVYLLSKNNLEDISEIVSDITDKSAMPLILGGDPRVSEVLLGNKDMYKESTGVIVFSNTMSLPGAIDDKEVDVFKLIKNVCNHDEVNIMIVGVNGYQSQAIAESLSSPCGGIITAEEVYSKDINETLVSIQGFLDSHNNIICSLDLGVLDIGYAAGTPVANIGGLTPEHLIRITDDIKIGKKLKGLVVTNVAPSLDKRKHTEYLAAHALLNLIQDFIFEEVLD